MEFENILNQLQSHFTVGELMDFLGADWSVVLSSPDILDLIEENLGDIKEEIGVS